MKNINIIIASATFIFFAQPIIAGSIGYKTISRYMEWEPDCYKPSEPYFSVYDVDSYNYAVSEYNYYLSEVEIYIACIQDEAESDIVLTRKAIINGFEERQSEVLNELESAQFSLQTSRAFLD